MLEKYRDYVLLNKNILVAFSISITISAIIAQLFSGEAAYLNSTFTLIVDYIVYFSTFGFLFYLDNRKKYLLESGKIDGIKLRKDLLKLISSLGISEIIYTIVRWFLQYYLLTIQYEPYLASLISQGFSTIIYMIIVNLSIKITRLYK